MLVRRLFGPLVVALVVALGASGMLPPVACADTREDEVKALKEELAAIASRAASPDTSEDDVKALKAQLEAITKRLDELTKKQDDLTKKQEENAKAQDKVQKLLKGFYGQFDVSGDDTTKGIAGKVATQYTLANFPPDTTTLTTSIHAPAVGRVGWMPALSTNQSKVGYRGDHGIGKGNTKFVFQIEAGIAITSSPGLNTSSTQQANLTKAGLGFGDSFIGIGNKAWGTFKFGTTYAPYKKSTDRLNPFSGLLGDYAVVMGNSGGDNRVEFGTRLDHSVWYESPQLGHAVNFDVLFSPGQNRTYDNVVQSSGSPDCNGGNLPGSGNLPLNCDDGGFDDGFSTALKVDTHGFYATVAFEYHHNVNRNSDGIGSNNYRYQIFAFNNPTLVISPANNPQGLPGSALGPYTTDIGNETAFKVGSQSA